MKKIYLRSIEGNAISIFQIIFFNKVLSISRNKSWTNGQKHGWKVELMERNTTNL